MGLSRTVKKHRVVCKGKVIQSPKRYSMTQKEFMATGVNNKVSRKTKSKK